MLLAVLYALAMYRFSVWRSLKALDRQSQPLTDPAITRLADQMAVTLGLPAIKVQVYEIAPVNGLAAPDGRIFLTRGFIEKYREGQVTAEEMASVIAHELGHVALGHSRRRMIDFAGQNASFILLSTVLNRFLPFIGAWIASAITTALAARLSRCDENEADAYASALLVAAGIGTAPQKSLLAKLEALTGAAGGAAPAWLASHPKTAERIAAIAAREVAWAVRQPAVLPNSAK